MEDIIIELEDEIAALRATINRAHFWLDKGEFKMSYMVLTKALGKGYEEE